LLSVADVELGCEEKIPLGTEISGVAIGFNKTGNETHNLIKPRAVAAFKKAAPILL